MFQIVDVAITFGHSKILKWALIDNYNIKNISCKSVYKCDHLHILKILNTHGYIIDEIICLRIVQKNHLHILKWIYKNNFPIHPSICKISHGILNFDINRWIKNHICKSDTCLFH
jgi:hypothetical protein